MHKSPTFARTAKAAISALALCFSGTVFAGSGGSLWDEAAHVSGVPSDIIYGMALVETGKVWPDGVRRPWPWTLHVNSPDASFYFKSKEDASKALLALLKHGYTNVDVGTMQVNCAANCFRVHSPIDLLDPHTNVLTAASVLADSLSSSHGDVALGVRGFNVGPSRARTRLGDKYEDAVANAVRALRASKGSL